MEDDVLLNKSQTIEECIRRIHEEYQGDPANLLHNQTKQDAIILNIERACQAAIDIGMRAVRLKRLGLPKSSRDVFELMEQAKLISPDLCGKMLGLVGFRNTAVHNYKKLDLKIVEAVINHHLGDLQELARTILQMDMSEKNKS